MYHIAKNGKPGKCRANTRKCPLGNGDHYESSEAAYEALLNGTAVLPKYPEPDKGRHTYISVIYHADDNIFRMLTRSESQAPDGMFVIQARMDGVLNQFVFKGTFGSDRAKLVGHTVRGMGGAKAFAGGAILGGEQVSANGDLRSIYATAA